MIPCLGERTQKRAQPGREASQSQSERPVNNMIAEQIGQPKSEVFSIIPPRLGPLSVAVAVRGRKEATGGTARIE